MDFFQNLSALQVKGNWNITIATRADGTLTVSVLFNNDSCGDDARRQIIPLILEGSPQELDAGLFDSIREPVQTTNQLLLNMEAYVKQQEATAQQSQMQRDNETKEQKQKEEKKKRYDDAMAKVVALEKEEKFKEAYCKMPNTTDFPEYAEAIRERKEALAEKFSQPSLFTEQTQ